MPVAWFAAALSAVLAQDARAVDRPAEPIRLVVMIAIDQMTPEQLTRLEPWLDGGLGRFARKGLVFAEAALQHGDTETAPGHTCYGTGLNPTHNGIVSNDWYAIDAKETSYCYADSGVRTISSAGERAGGSSPRNNHAQGLVDFIKAAQPGSKAVAISSKDRSAIGMSGQHPDLALWWSQRSGGFQTSSWYVEQLPEWVSTLNANWLARFDATPFAKEWRGDLPIDFARSGTEPDERDGELGKGAQRAFPHAVPAHDAAANEKQIAAVAAWCYTSPACDMFVCEAARAAVAALEMGRDDVVDVLCISLSSCDTVGHNYGPRSFEVTDVLLRADRELERLFCELDAGVGAEHWIASLTADHGVLELPETLAQRGVPAERISGRVVGDSIKAARARVAAAHDGRDFYLASSARGVRLSSTAMNEAHVDAKLVRAEYATALRETGAAWIEHALTFDELEAVARRGAAAQGLVRMEANSFDEQRTCDVVLLSKPWSIVGLPFGTTHGTPYSYDRAVPLAFYGPGFPHATSFAAAASIDAVPTLLTRIGVPVPAQLDGRALIAPP